MMTAPAIALDQLSKRYGSVEAVSNLSLEVAEGEVFGFLGLNGAGKTTTIRMLLDLLRPTAGSARIFGLDCRTDSRRVRSMVGYLPGELGLYPDMTGEETLRLLGDLSGHGNPVRRSQLLERLELGRSDLRRRIREYSTGMKRKLGLVQALEGEAPLVILDEPTEGLDPLVQGTFNEMLFELRKQGRTVFMSSHVLSEVERVCDRIAVIRRGNLVLESTVEEARRLGGRRVRVRFDAEVAPIDLPPGVHSTALEPREWRLMAEGDLGALVSLLAPLPVRDLEIVEPALEDVLQRFYREEVE